MTRLCLLLLGLLLAPTGQAQQEDPDDILDRMEAANERRIANVQNYTRVEKSDAAGMMPSVQYFERASDGSGDPVAAFRMVPPHELADSAAARRGDPTSDQIVEGMADAIPHVLGAIGQIAEQHNVDIPAEIEFRVGAVAIGADMALRGIAAGPGMDTNADALDHLRDIELIRQYPSTVRSVRYRGHPAYLITTTGLETVPLDGVQEEGVRKIELKTIRRWIDRARLVTLKLEVTMEATKTDGRVVPWTVEREDFAYETFGPTGLLMPTCTRGKMSFGEGDDLEILYMRRYMEMNQGPPSNERQHQLLAEALDDFEYFNCN